MQSEVLNAEGLAIANADREATTHMIFEGAKRELKFRQAAMINHQLTIKNNKYYLESKVDFFARGRAFVLIAFSLFLLVVFAAIYQTTDQWDERFEQFYPILVVMVIAIPLAFIYLNIEKNIRHRRLHKKMETKLKELAFIKPDGS